MKSQAIHLAILKLLTDILVGWIGHEFVCNVPVGVIVGGDAAAAILIVKGIGSIGNVLLHLFVFELEKIREQ
ncbi:MAG: hypothetical protein ABSH39_09920 [Candidatus Acidiferrum sp.]